MVIYRQTYTQIDMVLKVKVKVIPIPHNGRVGKWLLESQLVPTTL